MWHDYLFVVNFSFAYKLSLESIPLIVYTTEKFITK